MRVNHTRAMVLAGLAASIILIPAAQGEILEKTGRNYRKNFDKSQCVRKGEVKKDLSQALNLDQSQKEKMQAQRDAYKQANKALYLELKRAKENLGKELAKETPDQSAIGAAATQLKAVQSQIVDQRIEKIGALRAILTPEQFRQLNELKERDKQRKTRDFNRPSGKYRGKQKNIDSQK